MVLPNDPTEDRQMHFVIKKDKVAHTAVKLIQYAY